VQRYGYQYCARVFLPTLGAAWARLATRQGAASWRSPPTAWVSVIVLLVSRVCYPLAPHATKEWNRQTSKQRLWIVERPEAKAM
jgi:hypothetical protein